MAVDLQILFSVLDVGRERESKWCMNKELREKKIV